VPQSRRRLSYPRRPGLPCVGGTTNADVPLEAGRELSIVPAVIG